jgi:hypothetical protein
MHQADQSRCGGRCKGRLRQTKTRTRASAETGDASTPNHRFDLGFDGGDASYGPGCPLGSFPDPRFSGVGILVILVNAMAILRLAPAMAALSPRPWRLWAAPGPALRWCFIALTVVWASTSAMSRVSGRGRWGGCQCPLRAKRGRAVQAVAEVSTGWKLGAGGRCNGLARGWYRHLSDTVLHAE